MAEYFTQTTQTLYRYNEIQLCIETSHYVLELSYIMNPDYDNISKWNLLLKNFISSLCHLSSMCVEAYHFLWVKIICHNFMLQNGIFV